MLWEIYTEEIRRKRCSARLLYISQCIRDERSSIYTKYRSIVFPLYKAGWNVAVGSWSCNGYTPRA